MSSHGSLSDADSEFLADSLHTEGIKLVKNFLRTSGSTAARETTRPVYESTEGQNNTLTFNANRDDTNSASASADPTAAQHWLVTFKKYIRKSDDLKKEISELLLQLQRVGGHEAASIAWTMADTNDYVLLLDEALYDASQRYELMDIIIFCLRDLKLKFSDILKSLSRQNHAFRFLQRLVGDLTRMQHEIARQPNSEVKSSIVFEYVVPKLQTSFSGLKKDFRSFSEKSMSTLHAIGVEEEERATTRYLTLTTIATFFSSITATTLQLSFQGEGSRLSGVVNFFWLISLLFSVSSGINSFLGMLWRKSAFYSDNKQLHLIKFWFTYTPISFLAIAASMFIVGLNIFVYSSNQQASGTSVHKLHRNLS